MFHVLFKIVTQKTIDINIPEKKMLEFPVHEHYLVEASEKIVIYKVNPTKKTMANIDAYIEYLKRYIKTKYNAYSVEVGTLENQLTEPKKQ